MLLVASESRPVGRFTEFLMLMEFCPGQGIVRMACTFSASAGGHVVEIMNRRVARPFNEEEVLKVCPCRFQARACSQRVPCRSLATPVWPSLRCTTAARPSYTATSRSIIAVPLHLGLLLAA